MKTVSAIILMLLIGVYSTVAQDIITLKSGNELKAHILRINKNDVSFFPENSQDTTFLVRDSIISLLYKNGSVVYLNEAERTIFTNMPTNDSLYMLGQNDASMNYKGYRAAATGTLICSIFFPWGFVPAIATSHTAPSYHNLGFKDPKLMENPSYYQGYSDKAYKIKKKKVWKGFAIGTGALAAYMIAIAIVANSF